MTFYHRVQVNDAASSRTNASQSAQRHVVILLHRNLLAHPITLVAAVEILLVVRTIITGRKNYHRMNQFQCKPLTTADCFYYYRRLKVVPPASIHYITQLADSTK